MIQLYFVPIAHFHGGLKSIAQNVMFKIPLLHETLYKTIQQQVTINVQVKQQEPLHIWETSFFMSLNSRL